MLFCVNTFPSHDETDENQLQFFNFFKNKAKLFAKQLLADVNNFLATSVYCYCLRGELNGDQQKKS